jgi:hypothetical protein
MLNLCYTNSIGEVEEEFLKTIFVESIEMIKKDLRKDMQIVSLSQKEIGCVAGGSWLKEKAKKVANAAGGLVQDINQAVDKGARKVGETARELAHDFNAGRQEARKEENEVSKADPQPSAPADDNAKREV